MYFSSAEFAQRVVMVKFLRQDLSCCLNGKQSRSGSVGECNSAVVSALASDGGGPRFNTCLGGEIVRVQTCSLHISSRDDVNIVFCPLHWGINWRVPVQGETFSVQVKDPIAETKLFLGPSHKTGSLWVLAEYGQLQ